MLTSTQAFAGDYTIGGISYFIVKDEKMTDLNSLIKAVTLTPYNRAGMSASLAERWNTLQVMLAQAAHMRYMGLRKKRTRYNSVIQSNCQMKKGVWNHDACPAAESAAIVLRGIVNNDRIIFGSGGDMAGGANYSVQYGQDVYLVQIARKRREGNIMVF